MEHFKLAKELIDKITKKDLDDGKITHQQLMIIKNPEGLITAKPCEMETYDLNKKEIQGTTEQYKSLSEYVSRTNGDSEKADLIRNNKVEFKEMKRVLDGCGS